MAQTHEIAAIYIKKWLLTATKGNVDATFAWLQNRVKLHCKICDMQLTAKAPEAATEIDYGIQEFVKVHAHVGDCEHNWRAVPQTGSSQCTKCKMWLHGDAPPPTPVTLDFKKVNGTTSNLTVTPKIDVKPASEAVIKQKMEEYAKSMDIPALEMELKVKKIQLEAAKQQAGLIKGGSLDLVEKGLMTAAQTEALLDQQAKMQAELLAEQKAKKMALENVLKIKDLQDALNKQKQAFHDTGHVPKVAPVRTKPLKIATGRKFR